MAFIGPTPEQMRAFGLKHTARALADAERRAAAARHRPACRTSTQARRAAARIGYPVMLKSTAGGGGIGMRRCADAGELGAAFEAVERLARAQLQATRASSSRSWSTRARHVEVQIFGDGAGRVLALGERDCSVQRRNQKVIEETPAPGLSTTRRAPRCATRRVRLGAGASAIDRRAPSSSSLDPRRGASTSSR